MAAICTEFAANNVATIHETFVHEERYVLVDKIISHLRVLIVRSAREVSDVSGLLDTLEDVIDKVRSFPVANTRGTLMDNKVFTVHGRDLTCRDRMNNFLRGVSIWPISWEEAVRATKKGAPYVMEVIKAGMKDAQTMIILFTDDDVAKLDDKFLHGSSETAAPQPRPNVLIEAGMALALYPNNTIIVEFGELRKITDFEGLHTIRMDGTPATKSDFLARLESTGVAVSRMGNDWVSMPLC